MHESDPPQEESVAQPDTQDCLGPELQECPVCGAVGLPERIEDHDCLAFLDQQGSDHGEH
ncbi:hypothetical protein PNQ29_03535 [Halobacterium salinarum]|uniref:hypothetical protein n=1 Tax=Halobacterium salinarum TaxID=2242 RepID=UPI0025552852|nr:hypothetical protein [Halobacterium salinarum]MDL0118816.1 hypothetical protein [Halobacterium salinarum]